MSGGIAELAVRVSYQDLRDYLVAREWVSVPSRRGDAVIYRSPGDGAAEVQIPLDTSLPDYGDAMILASRRVAGFEGRAVEQVLRDLVQPRRDIVRYALAGEAVQAGSIGLLAGFSLVSGAVKSLLASACSVQRPRRFHPRMTLTDAESYVRACQLGQTEIGSYVLTIDAPLDIPGQLVSDGLPFGRRATTYLLAAAGHLAQSIRRGEPERVLEERPDVPLVSANLCEALVEIMPPDESADLRLSSAWSPLIPSPSSVPVDVRFDRSMFASVERLAGQLRPAPGSEAARFVGKVIELSGAPNPSGELEGEVLLQIQVDDQLLKARVLLGTSEYRLAGTAHLEQRYVSVRGLLHRGRRAHVLREPADFMILPG
jgi:hypothetical protein